MTDYLRNPTHCTVSAFWSDLAATADAFGLTHVLDEILAKPSLGHPMYADARRQARIRWLQAQLALLEEVHA